MDYLKYLTYQINNNTYISNHQDLIKIGDGKSASVFKLKNENKVIKIFYPFAKDTADKEIGAYKIINNHPSYIKMYDYGDNYLILDYIEGLTLFQFLLHGIFIKEDMIQEVDKAIREALQIGLSPADVHLKNLIYTHNGIKIIDLARFTSSDTCKKWNDFKKFYYKFYIRKFFPKKIPLFILNIFIKKYNYNEYFIQKLLS